MPVVLSKYAATQRCLQIMRCWRALTRVVFLKQVYALILDEFSANAFYNSQAGEQIWVKR